MPSKKNTTTAATATETKPVIPAREMPKDDAEVQALVTSIVSARIDLEKRIAERDAAQLAAAEPFAEGIDLRTAEVERDMKVLERWSVANKDKFGDARSMTLANQRFGWRFGNWATKLIKKTSASWESALQKLRDIITTGKDIKASDEAQARATLADSFVRTYFVTEANKEAMIAQREDAGATALLLDCGVSFEQAQTFYLEPNREGQPDKVIKAAA